MLGSLNYPLCFIDPPAPTTFLSIGEPPLSAPQVHERRLSVLASCLGELSPQLLAARDALAALIATEHANIGTRYPLPALPNSVISRSTSACMATRPATSTSPSSPEPIAS